ncbi:general secretion pathway protein D [Fimbriimonas ginsengisoli Gsoil 348]|uniref:General secretion pathway protein D n=2 Tax=Fimbriimonas ginsengisoli TaxID=1005039 RepID=A0A068NYX3_FIMGI|nr:general secretion pathway protein D [Fimbriimonas ginsengisoli Gsoil 348]
MPVMAMGQFVTGANGETGRPWEDFKLNPKSRIKLDYRNSNIDMILSMYQKATGITIVKDPNLVGGLTLTSAKPVSLNDAFQILSTTLSLKGFDMAKDGNLLVIRQKNKNANAGRPSFDPSALAGLMGGGGDQPQNKLQVYPIKYANASQLARVVNDVFTPSGAGTNPFARFGQGGGGGGFQFRGGGGPGGRGGFQFPGGFNFGQNQNQPNVRASSDDFSNSVIVNAPENDQRQVSDLIKQLDKIVDEPLQSKVFHLQYAASDDLLALVQNLLSANVPRGRGGATTQATQGPGAFFNAIRGQTAGSGTVTSDPYTNSLVVTATPENMALVTKVITELDVKVESQSSTVVIPLRNAKSDDVAGLLNQAFGQRQGTGTNRGGANNGNRPNTGNNATNRGNTGRNNGLGGNIGVPGNAMAQEIPVELQDPNATEGELMTNIVAQGFGGGGGFFGGGGQNQRRPGQTSGQQAARDANGNVVNVRDLTGQVTTISDPNTNSIIVVTTPENADIIRGIIEQIDRIPEQVMIETIITEATLDKTNRFGVEWKFAQSNPFGTKSTSSTATTGFGLQNSTPALGGFSYTLTGGSLSAFLNALQQDDKFQVLSTPRIFTSNNVQAEINISQSVPYITQSRQDANGNFTYSYSFQDVGIVLTVTPRITSNGYVTMEVSQTANDLQGFTTFNAPIVNKRTADTTVSVKDGETIILGGIIRSTVTSSVKKVPLLGDIPLLGNLFKSRSKEDQKTELLVFLTPRIVRDPAEARRLREEGMKDMSPDTQKGLNNLIKKPTTPPPAVTPGTGTVKGDKKNGGS